MPSPPWPLLEAVRHFRITVTGRDRTGAPVIHVGSGQIRIASSAGPHRSTVIWHESGEWIQGPLSGSRFRNTTEWRQDAGSEKLHLSHLRRGTEAPTYLACLAPDSAGLWVGETPHPCGEDRYLPKLTWTPDRLALTWEVTSPTDPYTLEFDAWTAVA